MQREPHFGDRVTCSFVDRPRNLTDLLTEAVARNPAGEALVCASIRLTWREVGQRVERLAGGLTRRGIGRGDRVVLLMANGLEFPLVLLAVVRLGAVAVPVSPRSRAAELRYVINQCGAVGIVHDAACGSQLPSSEEVPTLRCRVSVGVWEGSEPFDGLEKAGGDGATDRASVCRDVGDEDVALLMYTSGTTGHPKGAMISHGNLIHAGMIYAYCMGLTMRDRSLIAVPMSHVTGVAALIATVLRCASTLVIMRSFSAPAFLALAAVERMTHTLIVPAMYNLCLREPAFDSYDLSAWRVGGYGGAPMTPDAIAALAERLPHLSLMNCYGATETVVAVAIMPPAETPLYPDRVGRAVPGTEIVVVDDHGREVPAGAEGELWVRGPTVVRGYWDNAEATASEFTEGFWHSGDIGSVTADGIVGVHDRKKDMINRGGYKVFSLEVESVLCQHADVLEAAVVGTPCPVLGERVHAFVRIGSNAVTADALAALCAEQLSDYKVPETFSLQSDPLPRNVNGKLLKRQLRDSIAG